MSKFNIQNAINKAAKTTNLNDARTGGGGDYQPPAKGVPGLRFIAYVETGMHKSTWQGQDKVAARVELVFELHGKKWPLSDNGLPQRLTVKVTAPKPGEQPHVKSTYYKLFKAMNYAGKANHFAELLGEDYVGTVYHRADKNDPKKMYPGFVDPDLGGVPNIRAPFVEDEDGEPRRRKVPDAINELRCFLWEYPDADQWASIYIDGKYDDGKSKNRWQDAIKEAINFEGSPVEAMLLGDADVGDDDDVETTKADAKKRKADKQPEPEDDDTPDDKPADVPADVSADTPRPKKDVVKRKPAKPAAPAPTPEPEDDDADDADPAFDPDGDDPMALFDGDDE